MIVFIPSSWISRFGFAQTFFVSGNTKRKHSQVCRSDKNSKVLDYGCNTGRHASFVKQAYGCNVMGADINTTAMPFLKERDKSGSDYRGIFREVLIVF
ncbi:MAG: hypothetical protein CM1200mP10_23860 [Candidatus Neomarinimicrobiota bacterium]|nr:MAG: hypothetical protein CM1200mP10_23860 [Candidatus Neomarinimicrobiota bacterium]